MKPMFKEGAPEFHSEILMVSKFRHSHLVSLIGYCESENEMILVYEYMARGTLEDNLHKIGTSGNNNLPLSWVQRLKIFIGAARGLVYLHTGTGIQHRVIHRDVKSSNILLDENWAAKISDFGMSKIGPANQSDTHVSTRIVGTFGYLDPDYAFTGSLTRKSDVYSFGVVLFEVLCGRLALDRRLHEDQRGLAGWAQYCVKKGIVKQIIDPNLKSQIVPRSLLAFVKVADRCLHGRPKERPTMNEVLTDLELALNLQESTNVASGFAEKFRWLFSVTPRPISGKLAPTPSLYNPPAPVVVDDYHNHHPLNSLPKARKWVLLGFGIVSTIATVVSILITPQNVLVYKLRALQESNFCNNAVYHATEVAPTDALNAPIDTEDVSKSTVTALIDTEAAPKNTVAALNDTKATNIEPIVIPSVRLDELRKITDNFGTKCLIYEGTYGRLYNGILKSGRASCIKKLDLNELSEQEFLAQVSMASRLKHENVVELLGYSVDGDLRVLAYEYASNGSLYDILHGRKGGKDEQPGPVLSWSQRVKIAVGAAKGLEYLHEKWPQPPSKFDFDVRDFGIPVGPLPSRARWHTITENTEKVSSQSDVYSFGVVLLELLTGRIPFDSTLPHGQQSLVTWATPKLSKDNVKQCIDPKLNGEFHPKQAAKMAAVAALCTQYEAEYRPTMGIVVKKLQPMLNALPGPRREHHTRKSRAFIMT
ncbi:hypothetical protein LguiB_026142 [Lonicera macranthoides]